MFSRIVVPLNNLPESQNALRAAIDFARLGTADFVGISILGDIPAYSWFSTVVDPKAAEAMTQEPRHRHEGIHEKAAHLARELDIDAQGSIVTGSEMR